MKKQAILKGACLLLPALLLLWGLFLIWAPAPRYSDDEKRYLAEPPHFDAAALCNGQYTAAWQLYVTERLPGRGLLRKLHAVSELTLGKREVGGVIYCRDGSLARRMHPDAAVYHKNLKILARFAQKNADVPVTVAVAPRRIDLFPETLPTGYDPRPEANLYADLTAALPDAVALTGFDSDEWFATDHHWNQKGAYRAYEQLARALDYVPVPEIAFAQKTVSTSFWGSSAAAAGIPGVACDSIVIRYREEDAAFRIKRDGKPAPFTGFYDLSAANGADAYAVFLGGNCGMLEITRGEQDSRPMLLVVRDSFAAPLLPFLALHYRILAVDPRYYTAGMESLLCEVDAVLFLMGMQTVSETPLSVGLWK